MWTDPAVCSVFFRQFLYRNIVPQFSLVYRMKYTLLMATFWYWLMFHFYFEHVSFFCFFFLTCCLYVVPVLFFRIVLYLVPLFLSNYGRARHAVTSHNSNSWYCFQHACLSACVPTNQKVVLEILWLCLFVEAFGCWVTLTLTLIPVWWWFL